MAGSNQSSNLTGMLSQIGGAIGSMGSTYTDDLKRNIQNVTRPQVKPDDDMSMMNMADWAAKMGRTDEAKMYQKQAENISTQHTAEAIRQQEADYSRGMMSSQESLNAAVQAGDVVGAERELQNMSRAAGGAQTTQQMNAGRGMITAAQPMIEQAKTNKTMNTVQNIFDADARMEQMPEEVRGTPQAKQALDRQKMWKQNLLQDPAVSEAYNKSLQTKLKTEEMQGNNLKAAREQQAGSVRSSFSNVLAKNPSSPMALENAMKAARQEAERLQTPEAVDSLKDVEHIYEGYKKVQDLALEQATLPEALTHLRTQVETLTNRMPAAHGEDYLAELERIEALGENGGQFYKGQALASMNKLMTRVAAESLQMNSDERNSDFKAESRINATRRGIIQGNPSDESVFAVEDRIAAANDGVFSTRWTSAWSGLGYEEKTNVAKDYELINADIEPHFFKWENGSPVIKDGKLVPNGEQVDINAADKRGTEQKPTGRERQRGVAKGSGSGTSEAAPPSGFTVNN